MDIRHPVSHTVIEGENLERERRLAASPFPITPSNFINGLVCFVILAAIFGAVYAANAAQGVPV